MWKENKYFTCTAQSAIMKFIIHTDQFVIQLQGFNTSASPRIWTCDTRSYDMVELYLAEVINK